MIGKNCFIIIISHLDETFSISYTTNLSKSYLNNLKSTDIVIEESDVDKLYQTFTELKPFKLKRINKRMQSMYPELFL